eukprot:9638230-Lingulodinium_polyedra.AAC.1
MSDFIDRCWEEGEARALAADAVCVAQHFIPTVRRHLSNSWRLLMTWQRFEEPSRATPMWLGLAEA